MLNRFNPCDDLTPADQLARLERFLRSEIEKIDGALAKIEKLERYRETASKKMVAVLDEIADQHEVLANASTDIEYELDALPEPWQMERTS